MRLRGPAHVPYGGEHFSLADGGEFEVLHLPSPQLRKELKTKSRSYDHIVIDSPPAIEEITRSAIEVSHLAIIPIAPCMSSGVFILFFLSFALNML